MIYHVLPGDSIVEEFEKTGLEGETIVCRECLIIGPISADDPNEFWQQRASFILSEYSEDEIEYHEKVADELERLEDVRPGDEVNLWFEYELFCQVNMWFCISRLADKGAEIYRVSPVVLSKDDRWKGFGALNSDDLVTCFEARTQLTDNEVKLGSELWDNYRANNTTDLRELARQPARAFPYLEETAAAAAEIETRPVQILSEIRSEGISDFNAIFVEFSKRAGVYGFGDLQVSRMLDGLGLD